MLIVGVCLGVAYLAISDFVFGIGWFVVVAFGLLLGSRRAAKDLRDGRDTYGRRARYEHARAARRVQRLAGGSR